MSPAYGLLQVSIRKFVLGKALLLSFGTELPYRSPDAEALNLRHRLGTCFSPGLIASLRLVNPKLSIANNDHDLLSHERAIYRSLQEPLWRQSPLSGWWKMTPSAYSKIGRWTNPPLVGMGARKGIHTVCCLHRTDLKLVSFLVTKHSGFFFPRPVHSFTKSSLVLDRILFELQSLSIL